MVNSQKDQPLLDDLNYIKNFETLNSHITYIYRLVHICGDSNRKTGNTK